MKGCMQAMLLTNWRTPTKQETDLVLGEAEDNWGMRMRCEGPRERNDQGGGVGCASRMPADWTKAIIVPVYKGKGRRGDCGSYSLQFIISFSVVGQLVSIAASGQHLTKTYYRCFWPCHLAKPVYDWRLIIVIMLLSCTDSWSPSPRALATCFRLCAI